MVSFALHLLYLLCMTLIHGESIEFYVTSSGTLNQYCTSSRPCGSLAIVLWNIEYYNLEYEHGVTIYVRGHYGARFNANIDCHSSIHGDIIIIFDKQHIQSTMDWAPYLNQCYARNNQYIMFQIYGEGSTLQLDDLIYQYTNAPVYDSSDSIASLQCHHCIFSNVSVSSHFIGLYDSSAAFIDCIFENIIIITTTNTAQAVAFIDVSVYLDDAVITIDNCTINNVRTLTHNTYFIDIEPHITHSVHLNLTNVVYTGPMTHKNSSAFIYGHTDSKFVNSNNEISLRSCSFIGSVQVLYVNEGIFYVNMNDIHIETPQYITYPITMHGRDIVHVNTIHIGHDSVLKMSNVYFKTLLSCDVYCQMPIGLLYNAGECHLHNITMDSNYLELHDNPMTVSPYIEHTDMDLSTMHAICTIYHDNEGTITMDNISFSNAANYHFLYNLRGIVSVNSLHTIHTAHVFVNYGVLWISNSHMLHCHGLAFELYHGSLSIYNSTLLHVPHLIHSMFTTNAIVLDTVNISWITNTIHIASRDVSIKNSWFQFLPFGMFQFANIGAMESNAAASKSQNNEKRVLVIDNNEFTYYDGDVDTAVNERILIMNPYSMQLTRNQFILQGASRIPWIYLDTLMKDNCIASNTFDGNALFVQNGDITSCKHPDITPVNDGCLISFGTPSREYITPNVFIHNEKNTSSVITLNKSSNIILEWAQFIHFDAIPIQMIGTNHSISLFDINLSTSSPIQVPNDCSIKCYEIVDNNPQQIRQLQLVCDMKSVAPHDDVMQSVSSWSPYRIHLISNGLFYPGGTLRMNYTVLDRYDNIVTDEAYPNDVHIALRCPVLSIDTVLFINGATHECDLCQDGLKIRHITMDDVGSIFEIETSVFNDLLLVNNLNLSVVYCPQELMVSNESRCIDPSLHRYVAHPVIQLEMWIIVVSVSICLTIVLVVYFMCKNHAKRKISRKEKHLAQCIENPLVVLIGIGMYENYLNGQANDSYFIDGYFPNLGIDIDLENLSRLFRYLNYKIIGHETKLQWTRDEMMAFIDESAKEACEVQYDGLIVILSCHAIPGHIVTTNMKTVSFESIHEMYSCCDKPRIFVYDCCISHASNPVQHMAQLKQAETSDIADDKWMEIRTECGTVQSKMNRMDGSYLLHEFGKRILEEVQCLGQILDEINDLRQHNGKGRVAIHFGNDKMRYLKLIKGKQGDANKSRMNGNGSLDYESMRSIQEATGPPLKISHIAIERVYRSHKTVTCPSIIQSDKASTMSATRKDKFIRRKNAPQRQTKITKRSRYRSIQMEDIEEESNENQDTKKTVKMSHIEENDEEELEEDDGLKELIIAQNIIEVTTTDSSDTETDQGSYELAPIHQLPISASSTQL